MSALRTAIQGERVRLVAPRLEAAETLRAWVNDPDTSHLIGRPAYQRSVAAEEEWLRDRLKVSWDNGVCLLVEAIDGPGDAVLIGTIELRHLSAEHRCGQVGIMVGEPAYRGRGYGTEALRLLCRFAFDELDLQRIVLDVNEFNTRALRAYERVGFVQEGRYRRHTFMLGRWYDTIPMGLLREEFEANEAERAGAGHDR